MADSRNIVRIKFYGTRGSSPICEPGFHEFGGNTTCILIAGPEENIITIFDAGTGIRKLGKELMQLPHKLPERIFICFSHFHWDHIQGFPFFEPAYHPSARITLFAMGLDRNITDLRGIFSTQMQSEYFPIQLDKMGAQFDFRLLDQEVFYNQTVRISAVRHRHPGEAYSYCWERAGKKLVICTDIEHGDTPDPYIVELARNADLLIHDAQYTPDELREYPGWGHSSYEQAIEVARLAGVSQLILTHHDPDHDDDFLREMEKECQRHFPNCALAREGMEILLPLD